MLVQAACVRHPWWLEGERNHFDQVPNQEPGSMKIRNTGTETRTRKSKEIENQRYLTRNQEPNQELKAFIPGLIRKLLVQKKSLTKFVVFYLYLYSLHTPEEGVCYSVSNLLYIHLCNLVWEFCIHLQVYHFP